MTDRLALDCLVHAGYDYAEGAYEECVDFIDSGDMASSQDGRPLPKDVWERATGMIGEIFGFGPWYEYIDTDDEMLRSGIEYAVSNLDFETIQKAFIRGVNNRIHEIFLGTPELEAWEKE